MKLTERDGVTQDANLVDAVRIKPPDGIVRPSYTVYEDKNVRTCRNPVIAN